MYQYNSIVELKTILSWCYKNRKKTAKMGENARDKALEFQRADFAGKIVSQIKTLTV